MYANGSVCEIYVYEHLCQEAVRKETVPQGSVQVMPEPPNDTNSNTSKCSTLLCGWFTAAGVVNSRMLYNLGECVLITQLTIHSNAECESLSSVFLFCFCFYKSALQTICFFSFFFFPLWGFYSETFIYRYSISLAHAFTRLCMIFVPHMYIPHYNYNNY